MASRTMRRRFWGAVQVGKEGRKLGRCVLWRGEPQSGSLRLCREWRVRDESEGHGIPT